MSRGNLIIHKIESDWLKNSDHVNDSYLEVVSDLTTCWFEDYDTSFLKKKLNDKIVATPDSCVKSLWQLWFIAKKFQITRLTLYYHSASFFLLNSAAKLGADHIVHFFLQLQAVNWRLNLQMAQSNMTKMKLPNAMFELSLASGSQVNLFSNSW